MGCQLNRARRAAGRSSGPPPWTIGIETDEGPLELAGGGTWLSVDGKPRDDIPPQPEYPALYSHFAELIAQRRSEVDCVPLQLVSDAFLRCQHSQVEPFYDK